MRRCKGDLLLCVLYATLLVSCTDPACGAGPADASFALRHFAVKTAADVRAPQALASQCEEVLSHIHSTIGISLPDGCIAEVMVHQTDEQLVRATGVPASVRAATTQGETGPTVHVVAGPDGEVEVDALVHEVVHAVTRANMARRYDALPFWFEEGVADRVAFPYLDRRTPLKEMLQLDGFIDLSSLASQLPLQETERTKAIHQSRSIVDYIADSHDSDEILGSIISLTESEGSFSGALLELTGHPPEWWENRWRASFHLGPPAALWWFWLTVFGGLCVAAAFIRWIRRRRRAGSA